MRACIVGIQNIKHMTLISMYTNFFKDNEIAYDLIYIDKYGIDEKNSARKVYKYETTNSFFRTIIGKAIKGILFKKFAIKVIKENHYDFIVIWREQTASMFADFLCKNYKRRFCVNIRDLWNQKNKYITHGVEKAVKGSAFNTISSKGFLRELPKADYVLVNSINTEIVDFANDPPTQSVKHHICDKDSPLVITYIGTVRFYDYCYRLINALSNDPRIVLKFIGQGSDIIQKYVEDHSINNVICEGSFAHEDTMQLLEGTDIINSAFGAKNDAEKALMPIRYYYSIYLGCPVLTTEGTWVDKEAKSAGIGISVPSEFNDAHNWADYLINKYNELTRTNIEDKLSAYRKELLSENEQFISTLRSTINGIKDK